MARFYEIKSSDTPSRGFGRRDFETEEEYEAYKCGREHGWAEAMEEVSRMGSRRGSYRSERYSDDDEMNPMGSRRGSYRSERYDDDDEMTPMGLRRRRDSRGRYM